MRTLLLFRGAPGCGKSTFIEENDLKKYTLSADDLRILCSSPRMTVNGDYEISQKNDKVVWDTLFQLLEIRMQSGEFTVIDATNSKTTEMNRYKELAKMHRYRMYVIDMTDLPIEECKKRNILRSDYKIVPDEVIEKMYARFATQKIPSGVKVLSTSKLSENYWKDEILVTPCFHMDSYNKIHIIGDIHGCNTALQEYLAGGLNDNDYYIFCGDYLDIGIENAEVLRFLISIMDRQNVCFLEGNHEAHIYAWAHSAKAKSKEFENNTKIQLYKAGIDKTEARKFYSHLRQFTYFEFDGKKYFVCHGGMSLFPNVFTATYQLLHGTGDYDTVRQMCECWESNVGEPFGVTQVFGHRSELGADMHMTKHTYALEGKVEFGGYLGALELEHGKDPVCVKIKNTVFRKEELVQENEKSPEIQTEISVSELVESMRRSRDVQEKKFDNDISSFNFTRQAFFKSNWNALSTKARGLFIDTAENRIVARSYDKFFKIGERMETRLESLHLNLQYPVIAYRKENGYLGIVSYNKKTDSLFIASKSTPEGPYAERLREMILALPEYESLFGYLQNHNVSFVFEVVDNEFDPHIIEYDKPHLFLLDIIFNDIQFKKISYEELSHIAGWLKLECKENCARLNNWNEFMSFYNEISRENYLYNDSYIEGFVFEDKTGFMFKLKTAYYNEWKFMRRVVQEVRKKGYVNKTSALITPLENYFYGWLKKQFEEDKESFQRRSDSIITLRKEFYQELKEGMTRDE